MTPSLILPLIKGGGEKNSGYARLLDGMMDAILSGDASRAGNFLKDKQNFPAAAQLEIYTQGYRLRLIEAVEAAYPALAFALGKKDFTTLAAGFIANHPSQSFNIDRYTIGFADYVRQATDDVFVCELAALEGAVHEVYQAPETPPMTAAWAQGQQPATLAEIPLMLRGAARLFTFTFPVDDYVTSFRESGEPVRSGPDKNWLIVLRHKHQVKRLPLNEAEYAMLTLAQEGMALEVMLEDPRMAPYLESESFAAQLQGWFARWLAEGMLRQPQ